MRSVKGVVQSPFSLQSPAPSSQLVPCYVLYFIIQGHNVVYIPDIFFTHDVHIFTSSALLFHRCFPYYSLHSQICVPLLSSLHTLGLSLCFKIWFFPAAILPLLPNLSFLTTCSTNLIVSPPSLLPGRALFSQATHLLLLAADWFWVQTMTPPLMLC